ncbi:MAG TPA: trypsin-like peptidase domain-containing protein [Nitrososphaerales archaeon]|nr:trypsin-like peptidase domain-containing protein [Nitrososphaerales archaeon]
MSKVTSQEQIVKSFSDALVSIVGRVSPSVVQVSSGRGFGTGVVWDDEGHVVTNNHVVGRSNRIEVSSPDGKTFEASIVGQDRYSDIAVLKIEGHLQSIQRGESENLATGQFVLALANPFGDRVSAASGIVTSPKGRMGGPWSDDQIITDVRLNRGYSGGPLLDASGNMIGMNTAYVANRGIAIPVGVLTTVVKEIMSKGSIKRAYLGIVSNPLTLPEEVAKEIGQTEGLIVLSVEQGTPAKKAGVAVGDIIVKVDSRKVESFNDLFRILKSGLIGTEVQLSVLRGEKLTELSITPSEA